MVKVLISLDDRLLERLDDEAHRRKMSRSALVSELAARELGLEKGPGADPKVHAALRRLEDLFRNGEYDDHRPAKEIFREMRDSR